MAALIERGELLESDKQAVALQGQCGPPGGDIGPAARRRPSSRACHWVRAWTSAARIAAVASGLCSNAPSDASKAWIVTAAAAAACAAACADGNKLASSAEHWPGPSPATTAMTVCGASLTTSRTKLAHDTVASTVSPAAVRAKAATWAEGRSSLTMSRVMGRSSAALDKRASAHDTKPARRAANRPTCCETGHAGTIAALHPSSGAAPHPGRFRRPRAAPVRRRASPLASLIGLTAAPVSAAPSGRAGPEALCSLGGPGRNPASNRPSAPTAHPPNRPSAHQPQPPQPPDSATSARCCPKSQLSLAGESA